LIWVLADFSLVTEVVPVCMTGTCAVG
jgi:hypothetical protein